MNLLTRAEKLGISHRPSHSSQMVDQVWRLDDLFRSYKVMKHFLYVLLAEENWEDRTEKVVSVGVDCGEMRVRVTVHDGCDEGVM